MSSDRTSLPAKNTTPETPRSEHPTSRRDFLNKFAMAGTTVAVVSATGLTWRALGQGVFETGQGPAYAAWSGLANQTGPLHAIAAAVLAASAHNTQPWAFTLDQNRIELHVDPTRTIGAIDPFLRERDISLGCALENLDLALRAQGLQSTTTINPAANSTLVANIDFTDTAPIATGLYTAIPSRHSNRGSYEPLPAGTLDQLDEFVTDDTAPAQLHWLTDTAQREQYGTLLIGAVEEIVADHEQSSDGGRWYRSDWDDIQQQKDGITYDSQPAGDLMRAVVKLLPATSQATNDKFFLEGVRRTIPTSAAFGLITVPDPEDRLARLAGGRLSQRLHLASTVRGLGFQYVNYITERIDRARQLGKSEEFSAGIADLVGTDTAKLLCAFRIGTPTTEARPSPRRPVEEVLL